MFYDAFAALIGQSGDAMQARQESPSDDPRFQREGRQIATFLRRSGAIWDDLFRTLVAETEALERGLDSANEALFAHGFPRTSIPVSGSGPIDPLERYRAVNRALDSIIERLTPLSSEAGPEATPNTGAPANSPGNARAWASETLRNLRSSLAHAAEIQGRLVDRMLQIH